MTPLVFLALILLFVWCIVLSYKLYSLNHAYSVVITKTGKASIEQALHQIVQNDARFDHLLESLQNDSAAMLSALKSAVTRVGLLKFDPFGRTAGDQSFIIALLDSTKSGFLLTCMYTREGMRLFPKLVHEGAGVSQELSVEEKKAVDTAKAIIHT